MDSGQRSAGVDVAELNARIDRLPGWGLSPAIFVIIGLSYFFAFYDISVIGFTLPTLRERFGLTGQELAYPVTFNLFGYAVGAYVLGQVADRLGRRMGLLLTVVVLAIGGTLTALSWDLWSLSVFRFITGLGTGAEIALASTIITEFSATRRRGRYMQVNYLWGAVGLGITPLIVINLLRVGAFGWRLAFALGAVVAILLFFIRGRWLPESPRWLVLNGRGEEADRLVEAMEGRCRRRFGELPPPPSVPSEEAPEGIPTAQLLRRPLIGRLVVVFSFWFTWYITVYAFLGYLPTIVVELGLSERHGLLYTALGELAIILGGVIALFLVDTSHRKYLMALFGFTLAAGLGVILFSGSSLMVFVGTFIGSIAVAANSVGYLYTAEAFPTRARATAVSIGDGVGHLGGVVAPFIVVAALGSIGAPGTVWLLIGVVCLSAVVIGFGGIRTRDLGLTEISH